MGDSPPFLIASIPWWKSSKLITPSPLGSKYLVRSVTCDGQVRRLPELSVCKWPPHTRRSSQLPGAALRGRAVGPSDRAASHSSAGAQNSSRQAPPTAPGTATADQDPARRPPRGLLGTPPLPAQLQPTTQQRPAPPQASQQTPRERDPSSREQTSEITKKQDDPHVTLQRMKVS